MYSYNRHRSSLNSLPIRSACATVAPVEEHGTEAGSMKYEVGCDMWDVICSPTLLHPISSHLFPLLFPLLILILILILILAPITPQRPLSYGAATLPLYFSFSPPFLPLFSPPQNMRTCSYKRGLVSRQAGRQA